MLVQLQACTKQNSEFWPLQCAGVPYLAHSRQTTTPSGVLI